VQVDEMSITQAKGDQRSSVMLPNMLSSKSDREGKSADGRPFKVWDFIVHPESLTRCISKPALMELLFTVVSLDASHPDTGRPNLAAWDFWSAQACMW
jgi:hypothetical protein